jgi:hypothetical protein
MLVMMIIIITATINQHDGGDSGGDDDDVGDGGGDGGGVRVLVMVSICAEEMSFIAQQWCLYDGDVEEKRFPRKVLVKWAIDAIHTYLKKSL